MKKATEIAVVSLIMSYRQLTRGQLAASHFWLAAERHFHSMQAQLPTNRGHKAPPATPEGSNDRDPHRRKQPFDERTFFLFTRLRLFALSPNILPCLRLACSRVRRVAAANRGLQGWMWGDLLQRQLPAKVLGVRTLHSLPRACF